MQARELERVEKSLESFLAGLTASMGRSERRHWAGVYVRGLLLDGERKSVEPMATRLGQSDQAPCNSSSARVRGRPMCCSKLWPRGRPVRLPTTGSSTRRASPKPGTTRRACNVSTAARWARRPTARSPSVCIAPTSKAAPANRFPGGSTCPRVGPGTRSVAGGQASRRRSSTAASSISPWAHRPSSGLAGARRDRAG